MIDSVPLILGAGKAGLADLRAQQIDDAGADVGSPVSTGFTADLGGGHYLWTHDFPAGITRWRFYSDATPAEVLGITVLDPAMSDLRFYGDLRWAPAEDNGLIPVGNTDIPLVFRSERGDLDVGEFTTPLLSKDGGPFTEASGAISVISNRYYQYNPEPEDYDVPGTLIMRVSHLEVATGQIRVHYARAQIATDGTPALATALKQALLETQGTGRWDKVPGEGSGGSGSTAYSYTMVEAGTSTPIVDGQVWATTDEHGANVAAGPLRTRDDGTFTFWLDPGVTYYFFFRKTGYESILGEAFTTEAA